MRLNTFYNQNNLENNMIIFIKLIKLLRIFNKALFDLFNCSFNCTKIDFHFTIEFIKTEKSFN